MCRMRFSDGLGGWCVYESFVPGKWYRWLEKEILRFLFSKGGAGQIHSELQMSSKLSCPGFCP